MLGFLKTTRSFLKVLEEVRSLPKTLTLRVFFLPNLHAVTKAETAHAFSSPSLRTLIIAREVLSFIHFTHGFRSFHSS